MIDHEVGAMREQTSLTAQSGGRVKIFWDETYASIIYWRKDETQGTDILTLIEMDGRSRQDILNIAAGLGYDVDEEH